MGTIISSEILNKWAELMDEGKVSEAQSLYNDSIFQGVIEQFVSNQVSIAPQCNILFSILGFTPEPIILTHKLLQPEVHVLFTTKKKSDIEKNILEQLEKYLAGHYQMLYLENESFEIIYENLREQMCIHPSVNYTIDITGGKKSMVASAAIFARDYNCCLTYIDYDIYWEKIRRPMPGTEKLNIVYNVKKDLPLYICQEYLNNNNALLSQKCDTILKNANDKTGKNIKLKSRKKIYSDSEIDNMIISSIKEHVGDGIKKISHGKCSFEENKRKLTILCNSNEYFTTVDEIRKHLKSTNGIISNFFGVDTNLLIRAEFVKLDQILSTICDKVSI